MIVLTLSATSGEATVIQEAVAANTAPAPETLQAFLMFYGQLKLGIDPASLPPSESAASAEKNLDSTGGHKDAAGNYHFHATVSTADFTSGKTQDFKLTYRISKRLNIESRESTRINTKTAKAFLGWGERLGIV